MGRRALIGNDGGWVDVYGELGQAMDTLLLVESYVARSRYDQESRGRVRSRLSKKDAC